MTDNEKFAAFMRLSDLRLVRWNGRRDTEWKMSLAFWGLLAVVSSNRVPAQRLASGLGVAFVGLILAVVVVIYIFTFVRPIADRNEEDQREAFAYARQAEKVLTGNERTLDQPREPWAAQFQIVTTVALAAYTWWPS